MPRQGYTFTYTGPLINETGWPPPFLTAIPTLEQRDRLSSYIHGWLPKGSCLGLSYLLQVQQVSYGPDRYPKCYLRKRPDRIPELIRNLYRAEWEHVQLWPWMSWLRFLVWCCLTSSDVANLLWNVLILWTLFKKMVRQRGVERQWGILACVSTDWAWSELWCWTWAAS